MRLEAEVFNVLNEFNSTAYNKNLNEKSFEWTLVDFDNYMKGNH